MGCGDRRSFSRTKGFSFLVLGSTNEGGRRGVENRRWSRRRATGVASHRSTRSKQRPLSSASSVPSCKIQSPCGPPGTSGPTFGTPFVLPWPRQGQWSLAVRGIVGEIGIVFGPPQKLTKSAQNRPIARSGGFSRLRFRSPSVFREARSCLQELGC